MTSSTTSPATASTRRWWVIGTVLVALAVAYTVWAGLAATRDHIVWTDLSYDVVDEQTVTVAFDVTRPEGTALTCTVRAQDQGFGTVGTLEVDIPAAGARTVHREVTVRTSSRAVTGHVKTCVAAP
ncbi:MULTISPECIES: DUF4307 domain-containing protein [unclassified Janibacter]|uniref:DUF4307 domain-containing protein n=1 Tax=unclassified Janibacter TaxID=2649294 RepID=UPI003CFBEC86